MSDGPSILRHTQDNGIRFMCPGCKTTHSIRHGEGGWTWNGSEDKPTFTPSILAQNGHYLPERGSESCWCTFNAAHPDEEIKFTCQRCHSYITEGKIQFLSDCSHELAGQTVDLPKWDF